MLLGVIINENKYIVLLIYKIEFCVRQLQAMRKTYYFMQGVIMHVCS